MISRNELRELLGGKWFLNLSALAIAVPFAVSTSVLVSSSSARLDETLNERAAFYFSLVLANLIAIAICATICYLAAATLFRNRERAPIAISAALIFSGFIGGLKGFLTGFSAAILGAEELVGSGLFSRTVQAAILGLWLVPSVAIVAAKFEQYKRERESLIAERSRIVLETSPKVQSQQVDMVRAFVAETREKLSASDPDLAGAIRSLIDKSLRPISHDLWQQESKKVQEFKFRELISLAVSEFPLPALWTASAFTTSAFLLQLREASALDALARSAAIFLVIFAAYSAMSPIVRSFKKFKFTLIAVTSLALSAAIYMLTRMIFGQLQSYPALETVIASWIWLFELTLVGSIYYSVRSARDQVRAQLASLYEVDSLDSASKTALSNLQSRHVANFLHGQVQNKLFSISLRVDNQKSISNQVALEEVEAILNSLEGELSKPNQNSLDFGLTELVNQWSGFAKVEFQMSRDSEALSPTAVDEILQICQEGVANAVRHGFAKEIDICCQLGTATKTIVIEDDGLGPRKGRPGLGSKYFEFVSSGNWSFAGNESGGSRLEVNIG